MPKRTETYGRPGAVGDLGGEALADALDEPEHARRVGGLVAADVDEPGDARGLGRLQHVVGPDDVGLPRLGRVELEQRQVLQRGGVEDDLRAVLLEDLEDALTIPDVGEHERRRVEQGPTLELELGGVEARFVPVEHHQRRWARRTAAGGTARQPIEPPAPVTSTRRPVM